MTVQTTKQFSFHPSDYINLYRWVHIYSHCKYHSLPLAGKFFLPSSLFSLMKCFSQIISSEEYYVDGLNPLTYILLCSLYCSFLFFHKCRFISCVSSCDLCVSNYSVVPGDKNMFCSVCSFLLHLLFSIVFNIV